MTIAVPRLLTCLSVGVIISIAPVQAETFPDMTAGKQAYRAKDYQEAFDNWKPLADFGIPEAQLSLGRMYERGQGVPTDIQTAKDLYHRALTNNEIKAAYYLGQYYERHPPVKIIHQSHAEKTSQKLADAIVGKKGLGSAQNTEHPIQSVTLPESHSDYSRAMNYYEKALEGGYMRAARNIGRMIEKGRVPDAGDVQALAHYYVAQDSGIQNASPLAYALEEKLSQKEKTEARTLADHILSAHNVAPREPRGLYRLGGTLKTQIIGEDGTDLGTRTDEFESGLALEGRVGLALYPDEDITVYIEARMLENMGVTTTTDDDGEEQMGSSFMELREAWVSFKNLFGNPRLSIKAGRQRVREDYGLWWNRDFDALRLSLDSTLTSGFIAAGQNLDDYRIGEDATFEGEEKDRLRVMGEVSHRLAPAHRIEGRFLYENDHSGTQAIGSVIDNDDRDDEDADLLWLGVRVAGQFDGLQSALRYRLDGIGVTGSETLTDSTNGPGGGQRTITSNRERDVMGWAVDGQIDAVMARWPLSPVFTAGYAYASGDSNPAGTGDDHAFRQSGLEGNTSRPGDQPFRSNTRNYGEALRPELSNLHIAQLGVSIPMLSASNLTATYYNYWLDEQAGGLRSSVISAPLNGTDDHIGQAIDFTADIPIGEEMNLGHDIARSLSSRFIMGGFRAGDAYGTAEGEYAWRGTAELRIRF